MDPTTSELLAKWDRCVQLVREVFARKQHDYGPANIATAGERGVALRANDKVQRLMTLLDGRTPQVDESLLDTWMDLADYGIIGMLVHRGEWPTTGEAPTACPYCGSERTPR